MLYDEYFFDRENSLHHDHVQQYKQELFYHITIRDLKLLYNSIRDQDDHMHLDELGYDLNKNQQYISFFYLNYFKLPIIITFSLRFFDSFNCSFNQANCFDVIPPLN